MSPIKWKVMPGRKRKTPPTHCPALERILSKKEFGSVQWPD